ncbi:GMC family oxidoreductase [Myxococcota bacterium]|nr:GMC family oxidoreductase [Myxococcota bacterium]MCZ7618000.1 GMC family oxidoreductase [Myxococcota bacterium]
MSGSVEVFADYTGPVIDRADVVVVGSGPCGAVAAYELALAGKDVVLLEEGPPFTPAEFELDGALSMARTMREGGLRFTTGFVMPTMQAIALGGGSLVNSAICGRCPEFRLQEWADAADLDHTSRRELEPHYDAIAGFLGIAPTPDDVQGPRNLLFRDGCKVLGWSSEPCTRNVVGCRGSGECFTGCRARAKQSMDISYVPAAIRAGARVYTSVQVQRVRSAGRRVTGIEGRVVAPFTGAPGVSVRIEAQAIVLAAGALATPLLLRRSGDLANASKQVGENVQFHPGTSVMGVFPDAVDAVFGATQGYQSLQFLREGFKLETLWAPPSVLAVRMPGVGLELKRKLLDMQRAAIWDAIASCHRSRGSVRERGRSQQPAIRWRFDPHDAEILGRAVWALTQIFFAAGAERVLPGVAGLPDALHSLDEARILERRPARASDLVVASTHVFGSTRMHGDPARGVVDEDGKAHDLDNLYVVDTGVFPGSPAVNPMFTGMALARRAAQTLAGRV